MHECTWNFCYETNLFNSRYSKSTGENEEKQKGWYGNGNFDIFIFYILCRHTVATSGGYSKFFKYNTKFSIKCYS